MNNTASVIVQDVIAYGSMLFLVFNRWNMNPKYFVDNDLQTYLHPYYISLANPIFQQHNAPSHSAGITKEFLDHAQINRLP